MVDRASLLSSVGVGVAIVGSAIGDQLLALAGPLLALAVSVWTEYRSRRSDHREEMERAGTCARAEYYLHRAMRAEADLVRMRAEPTAVTPPFAPGEAATDA